MSESGQKSFIKRVALAAAATATLTLVAAPASALNYSNPLGISTPGYLLPTKQARETLSRHRPRIGAQVQGLRQRGLPLHGDSQPNYDVPILCR